jgi:hypothetical protein
MPFVRSLLLLLLASKGGKDEVGDEDPGKRERVQHYSSSSSSSSFDGKKRKSILCFLLIFSFALPYSPSTIATKAFFSSFSSSMPLFHIPLSFSISIFGLKIHASKTVITNCSYQWARKRHFVTLINVLAFQQILLLKTST